ncbi:enzymatic polyprotein [Labeo rohita]|uniref:Enzymatic polyprotein n=1 Tax=Labeo rohita TaxID=84645 RepID=A0ABQ8M4X4_LABRO|nr:enzymatic polyprotein [Labeo rohita]
MAAVSNVIPFGLLFMRPLQWCLKTKGVLPEGKPALHDQGHAAMPTCLGHVEKTLVLVSGPGAGSSLSPRMLAMDASLIGWGVVMSGPPARGLWSNHHPDLRGQALLGKGRGPPHSSVPVSPRCPREISLPTLPVLQGAAVSSEPTPQSSARKRSGAGELATPRGYCIQFGAPPPPFYGISTVVSPEQGLVMEQEVETLLRKEATEAVPPHVRESGFYSRSEDWFVTVDLKDTYFHVSIFPQHMKFLRFAFTGKAYQYQVLLRTTYLGVGFDHDAGTFVTCSVRSILTAVTRVKEGRSLTVKQSQQLLGLMAAASNVIPFGLLYMRPRQWWLRTKGFSPRGSPFCMIKVMRQCLRALDMWKKPWFLSQGPVLGAPCCRVTLATDVSLTGWGAVMSGHPARSLWSSRHLTWHISCLEMLAMFRALKHFLPDLIGHHVLVRTDNTAVDKPLSLRAVHVPGHLNMGADILSRQGLRPGEWMLHPPWGLDAMVQMWPRLRLYAFPLIALLPGAGVLEFVGVAPEGAHFIAPGLSTEVVETILQSRAPSSRKLYALKWKPFTSWCGDCQQDSVNCPVGTVLRFLQVRFSTGLAHSTLKVYVAAISAYHAPLGGSSVGWNPLVTRFLRGALRPRPLARCSLLSVVGMLFHSFESSDLPFLGLCSFTLGRDLKSAGVGISFPKRFDAARVPEGERLSACFSIQKLPAACTARAFKLPGLYVTPPVTSRFSIGLFAHVFQSVVTLEAFPKRFDAASCSLGEPWLHT